MTERKAFALVMALIAVVAVWTLAIQWMSRPRLPAMTVTDTEEQVNQVLTDGRCSLNAATLEELDQLPGIGPVLAQRIVDLREERGGFSAVDELLDIRGIGEATLEKIRPYVYVESELEGME